MVLLRLKTIDEDLYLVLIENIYLKDGDSPLLNVVNGSHIGIKVYFPEQVSPLKDLLYV